MPKIRFTSALKRFFPTLSEMEMEGETVRDILTNLEKAYPGISTYLLQDDGTLRKHVNIFIQGNLVENRRSLMDPVKNTDEVLIFQALSGG